MNITREEVKKVARLARLELRAEEIDQLTGQLDLILEYVTKLEEVDTTGVKPTTHTQMISNRFRDDLVSPSLERKEALANAPRQNGEAFIVPRVI